MIVFTVLIVAVLSQNVLSKETDKDLELKLVHVIFRHGARTPVESYPTDPNKENNYEPYGWGQLVNKGKLGMFELGSLLRKRYDDFLGADFKESDVYAQTTEKTRTKMSLQLVLAGLYPPRGTSMEWNKDLNWQPIPYSYEPIATDSLLLVRNPCPRYSEELERVLKTEVVEEIESNSEMFATLSNLTGLTIKSPDDILGIYSTLEAQSDFGLELPKWAKDFYPDKLRPLTEKNFVFNAYNDELKRLKGGVFVKKCIGDWEKKVDGKLKPKLMLYSGHDVTIINVLSAFNVWETQLPSYGMTTMFELSQNKTTGKYGVEIFYKNNTHAEPHQLTIPGCSQFCLLDDLKKLLTKVIPVNLIQECKPKQEGYTPPPYNGP